jgi:hypothetical protein
MSTNYDQPDARYLPDPDAVAVTIGCKRDTEAEAVTSDARNLSAQDASRTQDVATEAATCPTCDGSGQQVVESLYFFTHHTCPTCHGTGRKSDAHSPMWLRTSSGKAGHAPRHLVRDAGGGMYIAACGLERPSSMWRDAGGAKVCVACSRTPQGRAACDAELAALFPKSLCDSQTLGTGVKA